MKRLIMLLLAVLLLMGAASAREIPEDFTGTTLEAVMEQYLRDHGLDENHVAISYYNTVTGESYSFNEDRFFLAASTYKLPLNMYYYDLQREGVVSGDMYIANGRYTLDQIHEQSLVHSNNELSECLIFHQGAYATYRENMLRYISTPKEEIDPSFFQNEIYTAGMMMDILKYLYAHSEDYEEQIAYMKIARPGEYFEAGVKDYEVAHKYGMLPGLIHDVGIIYTPQPFLLVVYTEGSFGEGICADVAAMMAAYTVWQEEANRPEESQEPEEEISEPAVEEAPAAEQAPAEPEPEEEEERAEQPQKKTGLINWMRESRFPWWIIGVAALLLLLFLLRFL